MDVSAHGHVQGKVYSGGMKTCMRMTFAAAAWMVAFASSPNGAWAVELVPHRATYGMELAASDSSSGIVGASGSMSYDFLDACDGWVTETRISVHYSYAEGALVESNTDFVTWESKDGMKYHFRLRSTRDGQVTDDVEGEASLRGRGQGGQVRYLRPEPETRDLPAGTLFPTWHTRELMDVAEKGGKLLRRVVFDGADAQGAFDVNAVIGHGAPAPAPALFPQLGTPSWPVHLAFFPLDSDEAEPDFEMAVDYHLNGVAQSMLQNFKGFSLASHLDKLEASPRPVCHK